MKKMKTVVFKHGEKMLSMALGLEEGYLSKIQKELTDIQLNLFVDDNYGTSNAIEDVIKKVRKSIGVDENYPITDYEVRLAGIAFKFGEDMESTANLLKNGMKNIFEED